jgi:hypothetical protein
MSRMVIKNLQLHLYQVGDRNECVVGVLHEDIWQKEIASTSSNVHCVNQVILKAKEPLMFY